MENPPLLNYILIKRKGDIMPVPVTLGKLCTSLSEMEIGDYIPCVYESTYKDESLTTSDSILNINGFFSQLGVKNPYISVTTNTVENGGEKVTTTEKEFYQELSEKIGG